MSEATVKDRKLGTRGMRYYVYFRRGQATYLATPISLGNTVAIWYTLLGFNLFFQSIIEFALLFIPIYAVTSVFLGWQDFKRGMYQREVEIQKATNAITIEILGTLRDIVVRLERIEERIGQ